MGEPTPGPWKVVGSDDGLTRIDRVGQIGNVFLALVHEELDEAGANAVLIASAPELKAKVERLEKALEDATETMEEARTSVCIVFDYLKNQTAETHHPRYMERAAEASCVLREGIGRLKGSGAPVPESRERVALRKFVKEALELPAFQPRGLASQVVWLRHIADLADEAEAALRGDTAP